MSNYYVELSESELRQIQGGSWAALGVGIAIACWAQIVGDWDNFKNGIAGRRQS